MTDITNMGLPQGLPAFPGFDFGAIHSPPMEEQWARWAVKSRPREMTAADLSLVQCSERNYVIVCPPEMTAGDLGLRTADMYAKGRAHTPGLPGEKHWGAKLTDDKVKAIRASDEDYQTLADMFGVHKSTIGKVCRGAVWRHLDAQA